MATTLDILENKVQIHHALVECFHMVKRFRNRSSISGDIRLKCASFLAVSKLTFTNEQSQLWSYWTKFHEIFTKYRDIIYAVNAHIALGYPIPFRNGRAISAGGVGNFAPFLPLNWLPWQRPSRYRKKRVGLIICNSIPTMWCKDCENRSSGS